MLRQIVQNHRNVHIFNHDFNSVKDSQDYLFLSDLHWDNPKCQRKILERHLREAQERKAKVLVNGDFFCLMQGKGDPRRSKDDIRPEHNKANYLDAIVKDAVKWWGKYADVLTWIGYGNHETSIIKHQETDVMRRFVDLFNLTYEQKHPLQLGGYGGWIVFKGQRYRSEKKAYQTFATKKIHYFHGAGGGGPVTANMIQHQRNSAYVEGADMIWMGHTHDWFFHTRTKHGLDNTEKPANFDLDFMQTPTYKEEFDDRHGGFHVERGRPPKPIGGYWLTLKARTRANSSENRNIIWSVTKTD